MTTWVETFTGADGSPWPSGWTVEGAAGSATIVGNRGRLTAGPGQYATWRGRLERMADQRDSEVLLTFTPNTNGEWYLTVGARTRFNGPVFTNWSYTPSGVYVGIGNLLGQSASFVRWDDNYLMPGLASTSTGLPGFAAGTAYKLRFRVEGRGLYLRVWAASGSEPSTWNLTFTDVDSDLRPGKLTVAYTTNTFGDVSSMDFDDLTITGLDNLSDLGPTGLRHEWSAWSRTTSFANDENLPIASVSGVLKHLGVSRAVVTTPYTEARYASVQAGRGVLLYRDGTQFFSGRTNAYELDWDPDSGRTLIKVELVDDNILLDEMLVFPDPTLAPDNQTVHDYWTYTGLASSAMRQLILDQVGPTAHLTRRVTGAAVGADPGVGASRTWSALFDADGSLLGTLAKISVASGVSLGVRVATATTGTITWTIVASRDVSTSVKFSVEFGNVAGLRYRIEAPTATDVVAAGQGDLKARTRRYATTASSLALSWGRKVWRYIDRRDTAVTAELDQANTDALAEGDATVSLTATLLDSKSATFRRDYDLGDKVTVYVRVPGQTGPVATVVDVIREIAFTVDDKGVERITPAIGSYDAKAIVPTPTQQQLARIGDSLAGLRARK